MIARLVESREIAEEVRHFVFEADTERFAFEPGQFISLASTVDGKKITRAYSLAAAPGGNRFELCLNRVKEGKVSPRLFALAPGETIEFSGPLGYFLLRRPPSNSIFVATGTGIAPFRSILEAELAAWPDRTFTLLFGIRYEANILYRAEFERMAAEHPNFRFWPTLSRPEAGWSGRSGHVQAHLDEALGGSLEHDVYICGMKAMVDDVRSRLKERGFDRKQIIFEKYD